MNKPLAGWAASSVDQSKLSTTIESALRVIGGVLVFWGVISNEDLVAIIGQVGVAVPAVYAIWNVAELVFGIARKVLVRFASR